MAKRPELMIMTGELAGKKFEVKAGGLRLGRSSSNDIHVADEELSRNHCLFEVDGDDGIRLVDLASANGTFLNGNQLKDEPVRLKVGDTIEVGSLILTVVDDDPPRSVDLGLGVKDAATAASAPKPRSPIANFLWVIVVLMVGAAAYLVWSTSGVDENAPKAITEVQPTITEFTYEKVDANTKSIFRYELSLMPDGQLKVVVDDVPGENRHLVKSQKLDEKAMAELNSILDFKTIREIDREYVGLEADGNSLVSWNLRVVYTSRVRSIRIENTDEPQGFRNVREKLEAFSKNQLGVWALQYSREKLIELAEAAIAVGKAKWEDREVNYGNVFGAVKAYQEALFYLDTVNPKPPCIETARAALAEAEAEHTKRYNDQRFLADRAINLKQWESAKNELKILLEMVPDRADERNREASAKLVDVEKRLAK